MDETIDERGRDDGIAEDVAPLFEAFVGREHGGRARSDASSAERTVAPVRVIGRLADLVDDQQRGIREDFETRLQAPGGLRLFQRGDQVGEPAVIGASAALRRGHAETDRQVRRVDARWPPRRTKCHRRSTKPRSCRLSICSRRTEG